MDVVLDVDPGVDDALAILLALSSPELRVQALTVVSGNVPLDVGVENALRILQFAGHADIPVYRGADRPLVRSAVHATQVHGSTGLGRADLPASKVEARNDAPAELVRRHSERPGELTVIAVGPLTNLALAERSSPGTLSKAREIIVMGGAVTEPGNSSPCAEFNFFADPEAAREVIGIADRLTIVPLDVTHQVGILGDEIETSIRPSTSARARFFCDATQVVVDHGAKTGGYEGVYLHDPTAVAYAIAPDLFECETVHVDVETDGELTVGQLVADRRVGVPDGRRKGTPAGVTTGVDADAVLKMFRERVLGRYQGSSRSLR